MAPGLLLIAIAAALAAPAAAQGGGDPPPDEPATAAGLSEPIYGDSITETYRVETEHGSIFGNVTRPVVPEGVSVPVILTYSPYNVLSSPSPLAGPTSTGSLTDFYVPRGYARAVFDVVGTRESSGCYDYGGIRERQTGAAVIDFLGSQPWSNGRVGMIGGSYDGTTQWAAAIEQPEHLAAIIPQVAIDRWYDYAYAQGVRYFLNSEDPSEEGFDTPLAFDFGFGLLPPSDPSDAAFADVIESRITPCDQLLHTEYGYDLDPVYDEFWVERDYRRLAHRIEAAVLVEGGWLDHNVKHWDSTRMFQALSADTPRHLVMGQWSHAASRFEDAADLRHAWFDRYLLGLDTGVEGLPLVDSEANDGVRRQDAAWPPPGTNSVSLPLAAGEPAVGQLTLLGDTETWDDDNVLLTEEQALLGDCLGACLRFDGVPVAAAVRIAGSPRLRLMATTNDGSTHLTPVLFDVGPDGDAQIITRGFLNARNRNGLDVSDDLVPDQPWTGEVELWDVDWVLAEGHALGLLMMSANAMWTLPDTTRATTTLALDGTTLVLPVAAGASGILPGGTVEPPSGSGSTGDTPTPQTGGGGAILGAAIMSAFGLALASRRSGVGQA